MRNTSTTASASNALPSRESVAETGFGACTGCYGDVRLNPHLTNQTRAASLLANEIRGGRTEGGEGVHGQYPRRNQRGSIESHSLACMKGFLRLIFSCFYWHVTHSWQGGVLERIERHLAFLWQRLCSVAWIFFSISE